MAFLHVRGTRAAWQHPATENGLSKSDWKSSPLQGCESWQWHGAHCTTKATSSQEYHLCNWEHGTFGKEISVYSQETGSSGKLTLKLLTERR